MTPSILRKILTAAAACVTLTVATVGPVHATYVVGNWDPAYGNPFANLGWRGTTTSDIPADCLALGTVGVVGTVLNNGMACSEMTVVSAHVEFYALSDSAQTTVDALDFRLAVRVKSIFLDEDTGALAGLDLMPLAPVVSTTSLAMTDGLQAYFSLEMVTLSSGLTRARLYWSLTPDLKDVMGWNNETLFPANVALRVVPEPGSLALALAALAALGGLRRFSRGLSRK